MRRLVLAATACLLPDGATKADDADPVPTRELRTVVFGSLDAGQSTFLGVGAKRTLFGPLDRNGFVVLGSAGYGARFEKDRSSPAEDRTVMRHTAHASLLAGYQWTVPGGVLALFAGPEGDFEYLADGLHRAPRPKPGARLHGEAWLHPSADTLVTATAILGSARGDLWTRLSGGYRVWRDVFVGPETSLYADTRGYREWHLGLHATGFRLGPVTLRLSSGWFREEGTRRNGPYGALTAYAAF